MTQKEKDNLKQLCEEVLKQPEIGMQSFPAVKDAVPLVRDNSKIIFKALVGSQAYGTNVEGSDYDYKGVYVQTLDEILAFDYKEQFEVGKDEVYYEVKRFIQLLQTANPTVLELLYSPEDCIIEKSEVFDLLIHHREKFLTKHCAKSFGGYAISQIKKATARDKKVNWENSRFERKTPLDFIYAYKDGKTIEVQKFLHQNNMKQERCGLVALDHFKDCYALYYDWGFLGTQRNETKYRGLVVEDSNAVRTSSIPKNKKAETVLYFNKDAYSMHCKDYESYRTWLKERNENRYNENKSHAQKYDGKNIMHCRRLLDVALEIATSGTITVRRPNRDYLLQIRRGEIPFEDILKKAEQDVKNLDALYDNSTLPDQVDPRFIKDLILDIRDITNQEYKRY